MELVKPGGIILSASWVGEAALLDLTGKGCETEGTFIPIQVK